MRVLVVVALVVSAAACTGGIESDGMPGSPPGDPGSPPVDAPVARQMDALDLQMLADAERVGAFSKINRSAYTSTVGSFAIDVYASQDVRDYRQIHPETAGTHVTISTGTLIVRQVLDASGEVTKVTLMGKGPAGYDPTLGDWWFGQTDPSGVPLADASGPEVGRLIACHGCHLPRATDDYLFGVPRVDQR
jgi:hypothetical protein